MLDLKYRQGRCVTCGAYVDNMASCVDECHESGHKVCEGCDGRGWEFVESGDEVTCPQCEGEGVVLCQKYLKSR